MYFQIEEAQWFYEDFVRKVNPNLPALTLRMFSAKVFAICPVLQKWGTKHENSLNRFMEYKQKVPVRGAIILNETLDKCVLVKAYKSQSYSFPRGKINKDELDLDCAAREVLEETGFELKELLEEENSLSLNIRQQDVKLYIVPGVSEDTVFCPRTRGEIAVSRGQFLLAFGDQSNSIYRLLNGCDWRICRPHKQKEVVQLHLAHQNSTWSPRS